MGVRFSLSREHKTHKLNVGTNDDDDDDMMMMESQTESENQSPFSILHTNVRSLRRNIDNLQVHLLDELDYQFSVIGITETKITNSSGLDFNARLSNYQFEYVPTPLSCGGVGMYINNCLKFKVLERTSKEAFQALWIEIESPKSKNIVCGVIYRQHNDPEQFLQYLDMTLEKLSSSDKAVYLMGDFNIDLLKCEISDYSHNFLLSLQCYSFFPVIDKPTRVYKNSATLIDNIFVNRFDHKISGGNIVSEISDHYSQFCFIHSLTPKNLTTKCKIRDYSNFSEECFINDVSETDWNSLMANGPVDKCFSSFYNKLNKLINKHAPFKTLSKRKAKQFSKPWITKGLRKSIKIKNRLFYSGDILKYKLYRNRIVSLSRLSKRLHYEAYFTANLKNMKKTWEGINELLNRQRNRKQVSTLQRPNNSGATQNPAEITNIFNHYFASIGPRLARNIPSPRKNFQDYLAGTNYYKSFFFDPVSSSEVDMEILATPSNKVYGLYSCPVHLLKSVRHSLSPLLAALMNKSISTGIYPHLLKHAKVIPVYKTGDETDPCNYRPISLLSVFNRLFEKLMYKRLRSYCEKNGIFFSSQYGFRDNCSTQHAILDILNKIQRSVLGPLLFLIYVNDIYRCSQIFDFYLFADDTNLLYSNKDLKDLETVVNAELIKVGDWLDANKLSLNTSKSNFVIFHPYQHKPDCTIQLEIYNNDLKESVPLEQKTFVKYLGILIDNNLSWKYHIDYISSKVSKGIGMIARLRHLVPFATLLNIYRSLIEPYISYGLIAWGQAANIHLNKILILQKRALRLMYFADSKAHSAPLFVHSRILPVTMLYYLLVSSMMHDINNHRVPSNISMLFTHSEKVHHHFTRFSAAGNLYVKTSRTNQLLFSFARIGVRVWNSIPMKLRIKNRTPFKHELKNRLFKLMEIEEMNVDLRCTEICKHLSAS
ncbi:putative RNA-directed DNA polymerase from transposon X-element [Acropora cervicornis]|uniref:RNA-directed DNA polymerase from transposon X-element n=1 Tax=Acropora cervicornis TaxID=6130 RepID=A0AAD9V0T9_ACRCE|nr:putative RNA-directed DNA polymerase from transposon X-element [Acropora cervicornis]